jgi:hypothetical protein
LRASTDRPNPSSTATFWGRVPPRAFEQRLRLVGLPLVQVEAPEPDERWHVVWGQLEHTRQIGNRLVRRAAAVVQEVKEMWPSRLGGRQVLSIEVGGLGGLIVLGGVQQHGDATERCRLLDVRGARARQGFLESRFALTHLFLNGGVHSGQIGQRHRPQRAGRRRDSRAGAARRGGDREHQYRRLTRRPHLEAPTPAWAGWPCVSVLHRSLATGGYSALVPSGHWTRTVTAAGAAGPSPTSTRGSLADA